MKLNIKISFKGVIAIFRKKSHLIFWVVLAVILALDLYVLEQAVTVVVNVRKNQVPEPINNLVRVNFQGFNQDLDLIDKNKGYEPGDVVTHSPFGLANQQQSQ